VEAAFALQWWDMDEPNRSLQVRTAAYEGVGAIRRPWPLCRPSLLPDASLQLLTAWKARAKRTAGHQLMVSGKPISLNNVLRRWVWPRVRRQTWNAARG
jgi:hypothetical protein